MSDNYEPPAPLILITKMSDQALARYHYRLVSRIRARGRTRASVAFAQDILRDVKAEQIARKRADRGGNLPP